MKKTKSLALAIMLLLSVGIAWGAWEYLQAASSMHADVTSEPVSPVSFSIEYPDLNITAETSGSTPSLAELYNADGPVQLCFHYSQEIIDVPDDGCDNTGDIGITYNWRPGQEGSWIDLVNGSTMDIPPDFSDIAVAVNYVEKACPQFVDVSVTLDPCE